MKNTLFIILFALISNLSHAQILPDSDAKFNELGAYSIGKEQLFGELIRKTSANTEVRIFSSENRTYITWNSSIFNFGDTAHQVSTVDKSINKDKVSYYAEAFQIGSEERKTEKYILEYVNNKLKKFIVITSENVIEFY